MEIHKEDSLDVFLSFSDVQAIDPMWEDVDLSPIITNNDTTPVEALHSPRKKKCAGIRKRRTKRPPNKFLLADPIQGTDTLEVVNGCNVYRFSPTIREVLRNTHINESREVGKLELERVLYQNETVVANSGSVDMFGYTCPVSSRELAERASNDNKVASLFNESMIPLRSPSVCILSDEALTERSTGVITLFDYEHSVLREHKFVVPIIGDNGWKLDGEIVRIYVCVWVARDKKSCGVAEVIETNDGVVLKGSIVQIPSHLFHLYVPNSRIDLIY